MGARGKDERGTPPSVRHFIVVGGRGGRKWGFQALQPRSGPHGWFRRQGEGSEL